MVADGSLSFEPVFFDDGRWYEVDTLADLREAEHLFQKHPDWTSKAATLAIPNLGHFAGLPGAE